MDAQDITPARLSHVMVECMKLHSNEQMGKRLDRMGEALYSGECRDKTQSLAVTLLPIMKASPMLHFRVLLGMGIMIGMNLEQQAQELKQLESLT